METLRDISNVILKDIYERQREVNPPKERKLSPLEIENRLAHNKAINIRIGKFIYEQRIALLKGDDAYALRLEQKMDAAAEERLPIPEGYES